MKKTALDKTIEQTTDVDHIFDLIVWSAWLSGQMNSDIPVEESRRAFSKIKELINSSQSDKNTTEE